MDNEQEKKLMKESVLENIKRGDVKMKPRWHFILQTILLITGTVVVLLVVLYLASFILFTLRQTGAWFVPVFGGHGWVVFARSLPWILIVLTIIFVIVLEILVRRYSFAHRTPLLYSALCIVLLVIVGGSFAVPLHRGFFEAAENGNLPMAGPLYQYFGPAPQMAGDVHRGTIVMLLPGGFVIQDMFGSTSTVVITPATRLPFGDGFQPGDTVVVLGSVHPDGIEAYGIQKISE